jgi:glycylpeptide N-tetradecanoyltransferase
MHKVKRRNKLRKAKTKKANVSKVQKPSFPRNKEEALKKDFKFWDTQPVPKISENIGVNGIINSEICNNVSADAINLPSGYAWKLMDSSNSNDLSLMSQFLEKYYVEDVSGDFRLSYSPNFLKWVLSKPSNNPSLCLGVIVEKTGLLVGLITSVVSKNQVFTSKLEMAEIDFLCVHPKVRNKRLTPILIREISRRLKLVGISTAMYTTERYLPKPFTSVKFYHRPIEIEALLETGFTSLRGQISVNDVKRNLALPKYMDKNFVKLEDKYVDEAFEALNDYFGKYTCHPLYTKEEFKHVFLNNDFVTSYVVLDEEECVNDFVSYYKLPSKVTNKEKNKNYPVLNCAYLFYYSSNVETILTLARNMLISARDEGMHVFNALDIMENNFIFDDLKFEEGTGILHYYTYNYNVVDMNSKQIAKFLA